MRRRSVFRNAAEFLTASAALKSLEWSPALLANRLARGYARLLDVAAPRLRRAAESNLAMAFPEWSESRRNQTIAGVFDSIARLLVSFAKFPSIRRDNLERWLRVEGYEHVEAARREGRGVLFATAHLGNWELSAYAYGLLVGPMSVVARALDNPWIDAVVERRRALSGNQVLLKKDSARAILKALAANEAVGILIDQNAAVDSAVFVDFFGVPAAADPGLAKLAGHSGAAAVPGFALWSKKERCYILRFYPAVRITGDPVCDTKALQSQLESVIREYPDQWLWIHRRWKTRPPDGPAPAP